MLPSAEQRLDDVQEESPAGEEVSEPYVAHTHYILARNKTYALKYTIKVLTDDTEKKSSKIKQQRITHQSKQLTTMQTLKYYNIQENDTSHLSLELYGETETTESTEQPAMDTAEATTHNDAPNTERKAAKTTSIRSRS